jgi:hypothetical protein
MDRNALENWQRVKEALEKAGKTDGYTTRWCEAGSSNYGAASRSGAVKGANAMSLK